MRAGTALALLGRVHRHTHVRTEGGDENPRRGHPDGGRRAGAGGAAAQYTAERDPDAAAEHDPDAGAEDDPAAEPAAGAALAHDQMMRLTQQMGITASRLAVLLRSGPLTLEGQAKVADVLAEMAQAMNWTAAAMGQRPLDPGAMGELERMMEDMTRLVREVSDQATP